ncbi:putative 4'-phosphopantetheinyl transferase [Planomonospora parontospora subsp. parontospora]|uniref:4'-phosphopantetheinyl transferase n=2 Tax=Planomonospora parontospora TaxID=58119 RepID=A0AA37F7V1_9ACTN|nr:4'-phosphopantetheinyl transferase superfamily protein [Planomonospora parontospora]GGK95980.1 putative 4'-phosphopantetheinyl transferase [Planomonospora parontospora]GII12612.1 putative 4'-phosphopantetheinyl transferase [Planomonospora parontospora subsp. parontospora]
MIKKILPSYVVSVDTFEDFPDGKLFPGEEAVVGQAVEKRRREFTTARTCARKALRMLGKPPVAILPGVRGEPRWPTGVTGSITHCAGYRGAVLGESTQVASIGIDAEPNEPLPNGVLDAIALPVEREEVARLALAHPEVHWDRLLFSAKEAVYKAWFPLTNRWLSFENASVTVNPRDGSFAARLLVGGASVYGEPLKGFSGRWLADQGLLLTAIVVPAPGSTPG